MCLIAIEVYESQYGDNNEHGQEEKKSYVEVNRDSMHSARRFGTGEYFLEHWQGHMQPSLVEWRAVSLVEQAFFSLLVYLCEIV
jgi:hypothetical protein